MDLLRQAKIRDAILKNYDHYKILNNPLYGNNHHAFSLDLDFESTYNEVESEYAFLQHDGMIEFSTNISVGWRTTSKGIHILGYIDTLGYEAQYVEQTKKIDIRETRELKTLYYAKWAFIISIISCGLTLLFWLLDKALKYHDKLK